MRCLPLLLILSLAAIPAGMGLAQARTSTLRGGLSTSSDLDRRQVDNPLPGEEEQKMAKLALTAFLSLTSTSGRDSLTMRLAPSVNHDLEASENNQDLDFSLAAHRFLTRRWKIEASNHFTRSDDPGLATEENAPLSQEYGRKRFQRNLTSLASTTSYAKASDFQVGYDYETLRNESSSATAYEDYDRHDFHFTHKHRYNSSWSSALTGHLVRGLYDQPPAIDQAQPALPEPTGRTLSAGDDLTEYQGNATLFSMINARHFYSLAYDYSASRYQSGSANDSDLHQLTLGGQRRSSATTTIAFGVGPSFAKTDALSGTWGINGHLDHTYTVPKGSLRTRLEKGYDQDNFNSTGDRGIRESWQLSSTLSHKIRENLSDSYFLSYQDETRDTALLPGEYPPGGTGEDLRQTPSSYDKKTYSAGLGLNYTFWHYWSLALNYSFSRFDSEPDNRSDDQRLLLSLGVEKDLLRW